MRLRVVLRYIWLIFLWGLLLFSLPGMIGSTALCFVFAEKAPEIIIAPLFWLCVFVGCCVLLLRRRKSSQ
jgi:glycerol-3-phosphate acyltransferase PlsY